MAEATPLAPVASAAPEPKPTAAEKPRVSRYVTPGEGSSLVVSTVTVVGFFVLWWVATHLGWIRPLFLPKPEAIWVAVKPRASVMIST